MQKISPFLWFDTQAEEAVNFYLSIFKDGKIESISRYVEGSHGEVGAVMIVDFTLFGQHFTALNGGPVFSFTPAISFYVSCQTQEEVDRYWDRLSEGGQVQQCGWLTDKFGVSWQIVPDILGQLLSSGDEVKAKRVTEAMLKMIKLDIAGLQKAYDEE